MGKNYHTVLFTILCVSLVVVLGFYAIGTWGTLPISTNTMVGKMEVQMADGSKLISIDADNQGQATITFRGIRLDGKLVHSMSTQSSATYDLQINKASVGDPKKLSLQLVTPPDGIVGDKTGTWCIRFRNIDEHDNTNDMGDLLFGMSSPTTWYSQFGKDSNGVPGEVFDWLSLRKDGKGHMHNELFIPDNLSYKELIDSARYINWQLNSNGMILTEI